MFAKKELSVYIERKINLPISQNSNHCNFFHINFKNMFASKELSVHIYRDKKI